MDIKCSTKTLKIGSSEEKHQFRQFQKSFF